MQSHVLAGQYTMLHLTSYFHQLHRVESLIDRQLVDGLNVEAVIIVQGQLIQLIIQFVQRQIAVFPLERLARLSIAQY
jgi:hypothetical protein